jgi:hypothetical protein
VGRLLWFHCAIEAGTKPVPVIVMTVAAEPAIVLVCEREVILGAGLLIEKADVAELPPPGLGFITDICAVPALAKSAEETVTCNSVELTNVVGRLLWFHSTTDPCTKPLPVIVTVMEDAPTGALEGDTELMAGAGLFCGVGACSVVAGAGPLPPPLHPARATMRSRAEVGNQTRRKPA